MRSSSAPRHSSPPENDSNLAAERRLQVGAALLLGLLVLGAAVLRAGVHNIFSAGWWRLW